MIDFWNDGEYCQGCIAGAATPCERPWRCGAPAFIHHADPISGKDPPRCPEITPFPAVPPAPALQRKPPAPVSSPDNPDILVAMVRVEAYSTQRATTSSGNSGREVPEAAERWAPVADKLLQERIANGLKATQNRLYKGIAFWGRNYAPFFLENGKNSRNILLRR